MVLKNSYSPPFAANPPKTDIFHWSTRDQESLTKVSSSTPHQGSVLFLASKELGWYSTRCRLRGDPEEVLGEKSNRKFQSYHRGMLVVESNPWERKCSQLYNCP